MLNFPLKLTLRSHQQAGFSLVELMIASLLGIIVIGGMYSLFAVNKETIRMQSNISRAQEKANFALELLADDVRMAGWPGVYDPSGTDPFGSRAGTYPLFNDGTRYDTLVVSRKGRTADPASTDPLLQQNESDCLGNVIDFSTEVRPLTHVYSVNPATKELMCTSVISNASAAIIGNVEAFQVSYGVDTQPGPCVTPNPDASVKDAQAECMTPTRYVSGADLAATLQTAMTNFGVDAQSQLLPIKTVRLVILVSTEEGDVIDKTQAQEKEYSIFGQTLEHGSGVDFSEGRAIRMATRSVALRQALRGP